jgi:hypothetical protein
VFGIVPIIDVKSAPLQPLIEEAITVMIPVKKFHTISALIEKHEDVSRGGVLVQYLADAYGETVEAFSHIRRLRTNKYINGRREV